MPNGFHGSKEQWDTAESPLLKLDPQLQRFADEHRMFSEANTYRKNWPMRAFSWGTPIERGIILMLEDEAPPLTYELSAYAYLDDLGRKSRRREVIFKGLGAAEFTADLLMDYLRKARDIANGWTAADLRYIGEAGY